MLQTFPLNLLFDNAKFYLSPSGTPGGSRNNSYESLKDTSDMAFSTPRSSPRTPDPGTLSSQTTFPSLAPPIATPTTIRSPLCLLPFPPSQTSLAPKPDPATPSLLDTSISFARLMDRTGSPASFLTCSSGWDPGIACDAMMFPSLLDSKPSVDNFHLTQETICIPEDSKAGVGNTLREAESPSKVPFAVTTPFYFSPSLRNVGFTRLQPHSFVTPTPPRTVLELQPSSPASSKYSPSSEFSLESTTSSVQDDPFHWDKILAGLPPSPQRSSALAITVRQGLSVGLPTLASPIPSAVQHHAVDTHSSQRDSMCFGSITTPNIIPTIVVLNPDSVMVPTQASVSSIIGLYGSQRESTQTATGEMWTPESQSPEVEHEQELDDDDTDGEGSSSESEFEIVAVPALKVRLDTILETDEMDAENAFSSLMTLGSMASGNTRISASEKQTSTELLGDGRALPSFSSATESSIDVISVFSSGRIARTDPKVSTSASFASTAKLFYAQSGTSISGESTASSYRPTVSGSESDCPWLFQVEDGKILEVPRSASLHGGGRFADKLSRFPNVPKSPLLTPLPSPLASPLPSPSPANRFFPDGLFLTTGDPRKQTGRTTPLDTEDTGFPFSPYWDRKTAGCSTAFSPGTSTPYQPGTSAESSSVAEINFGELGVNLRLSSNFGSVSLPTDSSSSSGYSTKLSTAQNATPSYGRHVRFESADFRTSNTAMGGSIRHSPHHRRPPLNRSKACLKKKRRNERDSSDTSITFVRSPEVDCDHLPSSFSSGSISKRGSWWQHGRLLVAIRRVRKGVRGCLSVEGEEASSGRVWATERDYWDDHLVQGKSKRLGGPAGDDADGRALLRRIRKCT